MATPAKITRGPIHAVDNLRKRRKTGRIDVTALGSGMSIDSSGRLITVSIPGSGSTASMDGELSTDPYVLFNTVRSLASCVITTAGRM